MAQKRRNTRPLTFGLADEEYAIGIVVDEVSEVLYFNDKDIEDTPTFRTKLEINDILGMAKSEGGVKILLYIDRVLSVEEKTL
jgi:purine-binding chemotaxis protein CheW